MGEHINQIHSRLDKIERNIEELRSECKKRIESNRVDLGRVRETIVTKSEVKEMLQELNNSIQGPLPTLPASMPGEDAEEETRIEEVWEKERNRRERRRRFPFLPKFLERV